MRAMQWRVVVRYDDPRGGIWRGPVESREQAEERLAVEQARVHGTVRLEQIYVPLPQE